MSKSIILKQKVFNNILINRIINNLILYKYQTLQVFNTAFMHFTIKNISKHIKTYQNILQIILTNYVHTNERIIFYSYFYLI